MDKDWAKMIDKCEESEKQFGISIKTSHFCDFKPFRLNLYFLT